MNDNAKTFIAGTPTDRMDATFRDKPYQLGLEEIQAHCPYLFFGSNKDRNKQWKVTRWSSKVRGYYSSASF